jgi:hypothetical protein
MLSTLTSIAVLIVLVLFALLCGALSVLVISALRDR